MRTKLTVLLLAASVAILAGCKAKGGGAPPPRNKAVAKAQGWELLGNRPVDFGADRDVIKVTAAEGRFSKIHLKIKKRAVHFADLKVHFGNGDVHDVQLRDVIPKGGETRVIDLPGGKRIIKKVVFFYKTKKKSKGKGKAIVRLFGRH